MAEQVKSGNSTKVCLVCHKTVVGHATCPDDGGELINKAEDKLIGETFAGRYKVLSILGKGGMSTVYKAQHTYMDRVVALKLLHPHLVSDPTSVQRFKQEGKAAASLSHPNVITVFDFGINDEGIAYMVMDYLEGPSLGDLLDRGGPIPEAEAIDIFRQVCKGLSHAHKKGVIHRDLKPRNLVLAVEEDGSVLLKIVDFGIAKIVPQDGAESQHLTQTGEVFGSPIYMSPEQCSGLPLDLRSDIYSLGCVMYEVLTGTPPLCGMNAVETMSMHVNDEPLSFKAVAPNINLSYDMEQIVLRCLEKKTKKRYQTCAEVLEALPMPPGQQRMTDTGTVVMRLGDMITAAPSTENPQSTSKKPRTRSRKSKIRITSRDLAITFGAILAGTIAFIGFYPGANEDPGSPLKKMWWQLEMSATQMAMDHQNYGMALNILDSAVRDSTNLGSMMGTHNYPLMIETLNKQSDAYAALGKSEEQEAVVNKIVQLDRERWERMGKSLLDEIAESEKYMTTLRTQGQPIQAHLAETRLNWAGSVRRIVEIARRLDAAYSYVVEEELLRRAQVLLEDLYGKNFVGLADVIEQRCDCLLNQDRNDEIRSEKLYERIMAIRYDYNKNALKRDPEQDPDYLRAMLRLGQWQRDRNLFAEAGGNLLRAIKLAEKCKAMPQDQMAEYYGSYADFLVQTDNTQEASEFSEKAKKARKKAEASCAVDLTSKH